MKTKVITVCLLLGLFTSCATTGSIDESSEVSGGNFNHDIESWIIDFKYENLTTEIKKDKDGNIEEVVKNYGQSDIDLLIIDELYNELKNNHKINITKNLSLEAKDYGKIIIHPVVIYSTYNQFYIETSILDRNNELITRRIVQKFPHQTSDGLGKVTKECLKYILSVIKQ